MASFDSFETIREVYSDVNYVVYSVRKPVEPGLEYAVKLFPPGCPQPETCTTFASDESRNQSIRIQERAAMASQFVAPILGTGQDERGIWYATRFYSRSVNKMISGKVALPREAIQHILRSITQGALDFKRLCGRGHGDIRASNVQISKSEKVSNAEVVLCDPLPGGPGSSEYEISDVRAIGLMLLQLVRLRPIESEEASLLLPILMSPEWTQIFGKDAENWVALCNRLLDPGQTTKDLTLEQLAARFDELQPKPIVPRKYVGPAIGCVLFLVFVIIIWTLWPSPRPKPPKPPDLQTNAKPATQGTSNIERQTPVPTPPKHAEGVLEFTAFPGKASILVSNTNTLGIASVEQPLRMTNLTGVFTARSELGLGELTFTNVQVRRGGTNSYRFVFDYGTVQLTTIPGEAIAIASGRERVTTPATLFQRPGVPTSYRIEKQAYIPTNVVLSVQKGDTTNVAVILDPELVAVTLRSEPLGAIFLNDKGMKLIPTQTNASVYLLPWGETGMVAQYPRLENVTSRFDIKPTGPNTIPAFVFDYGILVLTNLPKEVTVLEGDRVVGSASQTVYERLGPHTYLLKSAENSAKFETNIVKGINFLVFPFAANSWVNSHDRFWTNRYGLAFSWVPNLEWGGYWPGKPDVLGGWVGLFEVTQKEYRWIMNENPSFYKVGDSDRYPVENVSWDQAVEFCRKLSELDAQECAGWHYALPTDEQFVHLATDVDKLGNFKRVTSEGRSIPTFDVGVAIEDRKTVNAFKNPGPRTNPERVGTMNSNQYGLYDLAGNVSEWLSTRSTGKPNEKAYVGGSYKDTFFNKQNPPSKPHWTSTPRSREIGFRIVLVPRQ